MNKHYISHLLLALLTVGLTTTPYTHARNHHDDDFLWGLGIAAGITAVGCGIAAACNALSWSDEDILKWAKDGIEDCDATYQQLNTSHGTIIMRLQLFGNRTKAAWANCSTEADEVVYSNPHFAPLHNALLVIKGDIKNLLNYNSYLVSRHLTHDSRGRKYYQKIASMVANLEGLKDEILSSYEYTHEEHVLQPKIHQLRQERLERERNAALREQANAQREQAQAMREQAQAQREKTQQDYYHQQRERERIRREHEQLRFEQDRLARQQDRLRQEQELQRLNSREHERILREQNKLRHEQERIRNEQERLRHQQEQQARELKNSTRPVDITIYNDCFPILLDD